MAFIKFIIIAVGIYYLLKLIIRAMFPFLVQKTFDKMQKEANRQQQEQQKREGEVTIDRNQTKKSNQNKKDVGDYVDFEEVD
jgi:Protein trafficking PGA2.